MKNRIFLLFFVFAALFSCKNDHKNLNSCKERYSGKAFNNLTDYVDPFIGTGGHGHTYPGASLPFGMVQLSPDTRLDGWDGCSGYHYSDSIIYGFSHTHLSGTGCSDYGDILLMPTVGEVQFDNGAKTSTKQGYSSVFSHDNEWAKPGLYHVKLEEGPVNVDLTATTRAGFHRYYFPETEQANVIIDLVHRDEVLESGIEIIGNDEIAGFRRSKAWAADQHVYFVAKFSKPFKSAGIQQDSVLLEKVLKASGKHLKAFVQFASDGKESVLVKVGISGVSIEGARKNLQTEIDGWDFDAIAKLASNAWENQLAKIRVETQDTARKINFYSALYHAMLSPNVAMDVDSMYRGRDLQVHKAKGFTYYSVFSLWDTYRAENPLFTIIEPNRVNDFINTFLVQYEQGGTLPVWELSGNETWCMIGYHSIPVIADAYFKGINKWDASKALEAMKHSATLDHFGLKSYISKGYIPSNDEGESVSKTLEYAYDDWCIAMMADQMGKKEDYLNFIERAQSYKNLYDPATGFIRAKANQTWITPFDPREVNFNYTEANCWQYSFYVPQDVNTLIKMHGGDEAFAKKLDELFTTDSKTTGREQSDITGLIGQYAHGNEPSHHMAYLYAYAGQAWKTQEMTRRIMDEFYTTCPDGLIGNEDCGQMSAWYVLSAMGFYPVTPGTDMYVFGSPVFDKVTISMSDSTTFILNTKGNQIKDKYIGKVTLNGNEYKRSWFSHNVLTAGGEISFEMSPDPVKSYGANPDDRPFAVIGYQKIVPVPFVEKGARTFIEKTEIALGCIEKDAVIRYTLDGTEPKSTSPQYKKPFMVDKTTRLKAMAVMPDLTMSKVIEAVFSQIPKDRKVKYNTQYQPQYAAGGELAMIDCVRGGEDFKTGAWQGYEADNFDLVIDLGKEEAVHKLSAGCFQDQGAWIFFPEWVEFSVSNDGKSYKSVGKVLCDVPKEQSGRMIKEFLVVTTNLKTRYVKVVGKNQGKCPSWHPGAGSKAWIFVDEITIE
jgi:predicted alpha-1,2-mannosidase